MDFFGNGAIGFQIPFSQGSLARLGVMNSAIRPEPMVPMNKLLPPLDGGPFPRLSRFLWPLAALLVLLPWADGATALLGVSLLARGDPKPGIFTLDTGRLNQETYDAMATLKARDGLPIEVQTRIAASTTRPE
jgi:hypothetical protein